MIGNIISVKQVIGDAKGKERFMPSDIAFGELERLATLGLHFERILRALDGTRITKLSGGQWEIEGPRAFDKPSKSKSLIQALTKAGL